MLVKHQASLDDKKKFTALVKDLFPDQAKNVNLLLIAYNMGIAQDIQTASYINNTFAFRYVKQLMDDFGMSRVNADWIVSVWCSCYGGKVLGKACNGVQREHNKKLNNGLPILHKVPPKRDYGRYFCIMAEKGGTSHGGLTEKLSPFFHAKKQEVNAYGR